MTLCECGCGGTTPERYASRSAALKGKRPRFINGHHTTVQQPWVEEDRGYKTPCWTWQLQISEFGYGLRWVREGPTRKRMLRLAHRLTYVEKYGTIPEGCELDHLCRNRDCVNPDHLEAVTRAVHRRRDIRTKLNPDAVVEIRRRAAAGEMQTQLAHEFGVHPTTINGVTARRTWRSVPD